MTRETASIFLILAVLLAACAGEPALSVGLSDNLLPPDTATVSDQAEGMWVFGFDQRLEPKEDVRINASLLKWMEGETGLSFRLRPPRAAGDVADQLCSGEIDFAIAGTVSYLQANERCGARMLARGVNTEGVDTYRAAIIVGDDASIEDVGDLRGRFVAFGAPNSTQGYLIPRLMLERAGLSLRDLGAYIFTTSHADTARAVTSGSFDAGGIQDTLALELAGRDLVKILELSEPYPSSGVVVAPDVPAEIAEMVREVLLELDPTGADAAVLYHWTRSEMPGGFVRAEDVDYDSLRTIAREAGLLES